MGGGGERGERGRGGGARAILRLYFPFVSFLCSFFLFKLFRGRRVEGGEHLTMTAQAGPRSGTGYLENPAAAMALRAQCNGI